MLDTLLSQWNYAAAIMWAALVNALPLTCIVTGVIWLLLDKSKTSSATTTCSVWSAVLAFTVLLPFGQALLTPSHVISAVPSMPIQPSAPYASLPLLSLPEHAMAIGPAPLSQLHFPLSLPACLLLLWAFAAIVQLVRLAVAFRFTLMLKKSASAPIGDLEARWRNLLNENYRGRRPIRLGLSSAVQTPAVIGYRRPLVLLPQSTLSLLNNEQLDAVLLHEIAHVRRYDDWGIAAQRIIEALFVFHPLVHLITSKLQLQREIACDDWVLSVKKPRAYALSLTTVAEFALRSPHSSLMGLVVEQPSQLTERIERILDNTRSITTRISPRKLGSLASILCFLMLLSLHLPLVMARPIQTSPAKSEPPVSPKPPRPPVAPPEISLDQKELASEQAELSEKQAALMHRQMQLTNEQIKRQMEQMRRQIKQSVSEQMAQMKALQEQLAHTNFDELTKNAFEVQNQMKGLQFKLHDLAAQRPELQQRLNELRQRQQELAAEQQRTAQELQRTLNELNRDSAQKGSQKPAH